MDTRGWHEALRNAMRQGTRLHRHPARSRDRETIRQPSPTPDGSSSSLATLHANNAYHALNRIVNFFPLENRPAALSRLGGRAEERISRLVRRPDAFRRQRSPRTPAMLRTGRAW